MFKRFLKLVAIAGIGFVSTSAFALTTLKQVQVTNGSQVDLLFDGKIKPTQIRTEFFNDTIQVSLTDAAVYPAKISSVNGDALTKIFAYQYAPKLVRCRITVKGKAEDYKDQFVVKAQGKILTLRLGQSSDQITLQSSAPGAPESQAGRETKSVESDSLKISDAEEKALLERVLKSQPAAPSTAVTETREEKEAPVKKPKREAKEKQESGASLAGGKPLPSLWSALVKLGIVIALFLGVAFAIRRLRGADLSFGAPGGSEGAKGILGSFSKLGLTGFKGLGAGKGKMIEVVSTHHLGPKKSIAVVKIAGRTLVLGVSAESINLITQIEGDGDPDLSDLSLDLAFNAPEPASPAASQGLGAMSAGAPIFSDLLQSEAARPQPGYSRTAPQAPAHPTQGSNIRAQIRSRLEGLKQL